MRRALFALAFLGCAFAAGCFIVTGSTDGYTAAALSSCTSASDCGDAGQICCAAASGTTITTTCQSSACAFAQLCAGNAECEDGGLACAVQSCRVTVSGVSTSVPFQACGLIDCSALP